MLGHDYFGGCHLDGSIGWEHDVFPGVQAVHSLCLNAPLYHHTNKTASVFSKNMEINPGMD